MNPIPRRTLLTTLGASLFLPLAGCGGGKKDSGWREVAPPTRGVGSFAWRTSLSLVPQTNFSRQMYHNFSDNTLRVSTQTSYTGELTEYTLDYSTGRVLRENVYAYNSVEAEAILSQERIEGGLFDWNSETSFLTRLDPVTRQSLWTYTAEPESESYSSPGIHYPRVASDGTVYLTARNWDSRYPWHVHALDGATGRLKWIGELLDTASVVWGIATYPPGIAASSDGVVTIEHGFKYYGDNDYTIVHSVVIRSRNTGKIIRYVPLFNGRDLWNVYFPNPVAGPNETVIGYFQDSVVAMRTK